MDDDELLHRYSRERSESAFAELVARHVGLVYSSALRQMSGNHHQAQEVTQMVFISLARKAANLVSHPALSAWLYRSTSFASLEMRRRESRRTLYERAAALESALASEAEQAVEWSKIRPVLDETINHLGAHDREAIVLRYFAGRSYAEIGRRLGLSENTARMRVERALDKLQARLRRRGITSTGATIAACIAAETSVAAPTSVASGATAAGLAAGSASSAGLLLIMSTNKITVGAIGLLIAAGAASVAIQEVSNERLAARIAELQRQAGQLDSLSKENASMAKSLHEVRSLQNATLGADAIAARLASLQSGYATLSRELDRRRSDSLADGASQSIAVDKSKLDRAPSPVAMARPIYPAELRAKGVGGQVVVDFVVDKAGNVEDAYAVSSTQPEFEKPAIDAVSQWQFKPGSKGTTLVDTHMEIPIVFSPGNSPAASPDAGPSSPTDWFTSSQATAQDAFDVRLH